MYFNYVFLKKKNISKNNGRNVGGFIPKIRLSKPKSFQQDQETTSESPVKPLKPFYTNGFKERRLKIPISGNLRISVNISGPIFFEDNKINPRAFKSNTGRIDAE